MKPYRYIKSKHIAYFCFSSMMCLILFLSSVGRLHAGERSIEIQSSKQLFSYLMQMKNTTEPTTLRQAKIQQFIDDNYTEIVMDAAVGQGEFLDMLFELLELSTEDKIRVCQSFKLNFSHIFTTNDTQTVTLRPTEKSSL